MHVSDANDELVDRSAPRWAWEIIDQTLAMDAESTAFSRELREQIDKAHSAMILACMLADDEPISENDPRLQEA